MHIQVSSSWPLFIYYYHHVYIVNNSAATSNWLTASSMNNFIAGKMVFHYLSLSAYVGERCKKDSSNVEKPEQLQCTAPNWTYKSKNGEAQQHP